MQKLVTITTPDFKYHNEKSNFRSYLRAQELLEQGYVCVETKSVEGVHYYLYEYKGVA